MKRLSVADMAKIISLGCTDAEKKKLAQANVDKRLRFGWLWLTLCIKAIWRIYHNIGTVHIVAVTLEYQGIQYSFEETWSEHDGWTDQDYEETMLYWWEEGNGACDCNRSLAIQRHCDPSFPEMECAGNLIELVSISVRHEVGKKQ